MKLISAVIKPFRLEPVRRALMALGVPGLTVSEVVGSGPWAGSAVDNRGAMVARAKVEVAVADALIEPVVEALRAAAATGRIGDGKIFVQDLVTVMRVRTAETDRDAL